MAWTRVKETYRDRVAETYQGGRTATRVFIVKSSTVITDLTDCWTADDGAVAIPSKGDAWPTDAAMFCKRIKVRLIGKTMKLFDVHAIYDSDAESVEDPTDKPWKIQWSSEPKDKTVVETVLDVTSLTAGKEIGMDSGEGIVNTAGDRFEDPLVEKRFLHLCTLTKNKAASNPTTLLAYKGCINSASITIAGVTMAKWTAQLLDIDITTVEEAGDDYYTETYKVLYDPDTHIRKVMNVGFNGLVVAGDLTSKVRINLPESGDAADRPQNLDDNGQMDLGNVWWLYIGTLPELDFAGLSLPTTF